MSRKQLLQLLLLAAWSVASSDAVEVTVNNAFDGPAYSNYCPDLVSGHSGLCTFRNAWAYCVLQATDCTIIIPEKMSIWLMMEYGGFALKGNSKIKIEWNNNGFGLIRATTSSNFPYTGTFSNTASATVNYKELCEYESYGDPLMFSSCGEANQDFFFRLYENGVQRDYNDDFCSTQSMFGGVPTGQSQSGTLCVRIGCYEDLTCSGKVTLYTRSYSDSTASIFTYVTDGLGTPELTINKLKLTSFEGGDAITGAVFNINGNCKLKVIASEISNVDGYKGSVIYVTNNKASTTFENTKLYFNDAISSYGGVGYFDTNNENIYFTACTFSVVSSSTGTRYGNTAQNGGGDLYFGTGNKNIIIDGQHVSASAGYLKYGTTTDGGGSLKFGTNNRNITVKNMAFEGTKGYYGGAIFIDQGNSYITLQNLHFRESKASQFVYFSGTLDGFGGGIHIRSSNKHVVLRDSTFSGGTARQGCAVYVYTFNELKLTNVSIDDATTYEGGALYFTETNRLQMSEIYISNSWAQYGAG
jgi:hypothetical protein